MSWLNLRKKQRISYYEPEEPDLDEYVFCTECADFVYEYCAIHGALLVVPDDKMPTRPKFPAYVPRAALTVPRVFLHLARSRIPGAGLGVFATLTLPAGVRFGPYCGQKTQNTDTKYGWQIYDKHRKPLYVVDAYDANRSNWMRYVNCARHWCEQNLVAFQYRGKLYYRTIKIIPRFTELLVFYGSEFANSLRVNLRTYNAPTSLAHKLGAPRTHKNVQPMQVKVGTVLPETESIKKDTSTSIHKKTIKTKKNGSVVQVLTPENKVEKESTVLETKIIPKYTSRSINSKTTKTRKRVKKTAIKDSFPAKTLKKEICMPQTKMTDSKKVKKKMRFKPPVIGDSQNKSKITTNKNITSNIKAKSNNIILINEKSSIIYPKTVAIDNNNNVDTSTCNNIGRIENFHTIETFKTGSLLQYSCKECNYQCATLNILDKHMRVHKNMPFACDFCSCNFLLESYLERHIMEIHAKTTVKNNYSNSNLTQNQDVNGNKKYNTENRYICSYCNVEFATKSNLEMHITRHIAKPHSYQEKLKVHHSQQNNTKIKSFMCETCERRFSSKNSLKLHEKMHTGEKLHGCNYCSKKFSQSSHLKTHIRLHTGERPYTCQYCDKGFTQSSYLKTHIRLHTGERPYTCQYCDKGFTQSSALQRHIKIHTGEKLHGCNYCSKKFLHSSYLETHIRIHTGERPFTCQYCDKKFTQSSALQTHIRIHTGEQPFTCNYCDKKFSYRSVLQNHIGTHTVEKPTLYIKVLR